MNTQEAIDLLEELKSGVNYTPPYTEALTHAIEHMKRGAPEGGFEMTENKSLEDKKPDDAEFERALSFFLGSCEAQEVDMWDRFDVIKSYAYGYKKLYWDLLASWADLKVEHGVLMERAQPKYKRVDLETLKRVHPIRDRANGVYSSASYEVDGYNRAIDEIKSKYGDLYTIERE